jgi:UDP-glucose 4-epimerase
VSTILILGGGGFLAGHIQRRYRALGWRVVSVGREAGAAAGEVRHAWSLPHPELAHLLAVEQPDICVNAAGRASAPASMVEPLADFEASTLLNFHILDDLRRRSPGTVFIHLSSAAVYGDPACLPITEDAPVAPISPYGWHKRLSEMVVEEHARQFSLRGASLRIFSAYGPGLRRQVVWDLISRAVANPDGPLVLQGLAEDSRDFIHGADVAAALQTIVERGELVGESYNLASGVETSMGELAALIMRLLGRGPDIAFDAQRRPGNPGRWHADIGRLRALGFAPSLSLESGVRQMVEEVLRANG